MNSIQYEELCRVFLADRLGVAVDEVLSVLIPNPARPGLPKYKHQIDLYWETGDDVSRYLNIANAKWRSSDKVDQPEVLLLQQVKQKVAAHKAVMLTSTGFTDGAEAAARDEGIALHIVKPQLRVELLPAKDRQAIREALNAQSSESGRIYHHQVVHRAFPFRDSHEATSADARDPSSLRPPQGGATGSVSTRMVSGATRGSTPRTTRSTPGAGKTSGGGSTRGGGFSKGRGSRQKG